MSVRTLCRADDIPEGGGRDFRFGSGPDFEAVFVVKRNGVFYAYANACPHMGTPLNFLPDRFFDHEGAHLLCTTHGALFRIEDGYCLQGPCAGKMLMPRAIRIEKGEISLF